MVFAAFATVIAILPSVLAIPSNIFDAHLNSRQVTAPPPDPNNIPVNWTFVGCFSDPFPQARTLQVQILPDNKNMTPLLCTEFCTGPNFTTPFNFAGTEFTSECFCDFNIQGTAVQLNNSACNLPCGGDANLTCGGSSVISIYQNHNANVGPLPSNKPTVGNWSFSECVTDVVGNNTRSLAANFLIPAGVTVESCTTTCQENGFNITGLEFGEECWCGNSFLVANITAPVTDCSRSCDADHAELCGAPNRLTIYTLKPPVVVSTTAKPTTTAPPTTVPTTVKPTTTAPTTVPTTAKPTTTAPTTVPTTAKPTTTTPTTVSTTPKPTTTSKASTSVPNSTVNPKLQR